MVLYILEMVAGSRGFYPEILTEIQKVSDEIEILLYNRLQSNLGKLRVRCGNLSRSTILSASLIFKSI